MYNATAAMTVGFVKLSALLYYRRLFCISGLHRVIDVLILGSVIAVVLWLLTYTTFPFVQCGSHIAAQWNGTFDQYCLPHESAYFLSLCTSNLILDVWILVLPMRSVGSSHVWLVTRLMNRRFIVCVSLL